jgi:hypothetical protein
MLPSFARQIWQVYMAEAVDKGVPQALRACYVNDRVHYRMLVIWSVDKYDEYVLRSLFPITSHECIRKHKLKARACILAMEDDATWDTMLPLKDYDIDSLYKSRIARHLYDQQALGLYENEPVRDVSVNLFIHLTSRRSQQFDTTNESEDED